MSDSVPTAADAPDRPQGPDGEAVDTAQVAALVAAAATDPDAIGDLDDLDGFDATAREALAVVLAGAWVGNLARPEGPVDALIDGVVDRVGTFGLIDLLLDARDPYTQAVGAVLDAEAALAAHAEDIATLVAITAEDLAGRCRQVALQVLHGDLAGAHAALTGMLDELSGPLEEGTRRRGLGRTRRRDRARDLLDVVRQHRRALRARASAI